MIEQVIAIDPGGTTGMIRAMLETGCEVITETYQEPWEKCIDAIYVMLDEAALCGWHTTIVVERYTITMQTLKKSRQYEALYCIGGLLVLARKYGCDIVLQSPGEAKALVTDSRLRTMGWADKVKGKEHARDALRHLVRWMVGTKRMPARALMGPEETE